MDSFYDTISAPQYYDFLAEELDFNRDSWFGSQTEKQSGDIFNEKILPKKEFDKKTPPKARSPSVPYKAPKARSKTLAVSIPLPSFLKASNSPDTTLEETEEEEEIIPMEIPKKLPQKKRKLQRKKTTLTIPVSPFFHTKLRSKRSFIDKRPTYVPTKAAIRRAKEQQCTSPEKSSSLHKLRKSVVWNNTRSHEKLSSCSYVPTLTEPKEFHFHTADRQLIRESTKTQPQHHSRKETIPTRVNSTVLRLTEPKSPFLMTKQRSKMKRVHSEIFPNQNPRSPVKQNIFSTFDRERDIPLKKKFRNSLTEPQPFHFKTEERSLLRANAKSLANISSETDVHEKLPWKATLTEPKPFHFATADRAAHRSLAVQDCNPVQVDIKEKKKVTKKKEDSHSRETSHRTKTFSICYRKTFTTKT